MGIIQLSGTKKCKFRVEQNDLLNNELLKNGYAFFCFWIISEVILVSVNSILF